ncbi:MAG: insulinase family protein [Cyanosarcina radialis HA8281-LM2]|jgi:zinc protease|nr:insulinase family protein [Cyanosarcina radialis HA8281-LM2]
MPRLSIEKTFKRRNRAFKFLFSVLLSALLVFAGNNSLIPAFAREVNSQAPPTSISLTQGVQKNVLSNGMTVLTKEVHTAPVVSVQVWYKIGSRDEAPGVNGIAHQLEHMLFKGTKTRPIQFGRLFSALGSESNAFTSYDMTAYYGTVERNKLNALLELEADRMQNSTIDAEKLESEKRVVISELQGYENSPGYRLSRAVKRASFPDHPYGLTVGGTKADVEKFTVEQVTSYYRNYYSPKNATLIVVGDFETEPTLKTVKDLFGKVPNVEGERGSTGDKPQKSTLDSRPSTSKPIVLKEPGSASLFQAIYPAPDILHPDVAALDVMNFILTQGRSSRLYQALVESGLTSDVDGGAANLMAGGWYELDATAVPGKELAEIDRTVLKEIANLQAKGVTSEEVKRAQAQVKSIVILSSRDIASQARQLGNDFITTGDYRFTDRYLAAVQKVKAADVQRVAKTYLPESKRTVGFFEPTQITGKPGGEGKAPTQTTEGFNAGPPVDPAEVAKYLPKFDSETSSPTQALPEEIGLANGLKVLLLPDRSSPTVALAGYIKAGTEFDSTAKAGLASLTADNLMNGTETKDALTIAKTLADRGAGLSFSANREGVVVSGKALSADLPIVVEVLADVAQNATFPENEFELSRGRALTGLKVELDDPRRLGRRVFQQAVYPKNHPFYNFPTQESLKAITREDLVKFCQQYYQPQNTTLAIVGDFDPKEVRSLLKTQLETWKNAGKATVPNYPTVKLPEKIVQLNPALPGKTQSVTYIGYYGIKRTDPNFYRALVLNDVLGGGTLSSRLGTKLRDEQGLTYGVYSVFAAGRYEGPFFISMQTAPQDAQKAIASAIGVLKEVRDRGLTVEEIDSAKASLASGFNVGLADPDNLVSQILLDRVYGLSKEEIRNFTSKIQAVTPEQVNQAAKELLHPDRLVVVTAGPPV